MDTRKNLLSYIARKAYDIGYGADKHFATYNFYRITPNSVSIIALGVGIYQLSRLSSGLSPLYGDLLSFLMIIVGLIGFYVGVTANNIEEYSKSGEELTEGFNKLQRIYSEVKSVEQVDVTEKYSEVEAIVKRAKEVSITKHPIPISDWIAHHSFFGMRQSEWVVEELNLTFFKDKVPSNFKFLLVGLFLIGCFVAGISYYASYGQADNSVFLIPSHRRLCWCVALS